jgi:hypothetical protein
MRFDSKAQEFFHEGEIEFPAPPNGFSGETPPRYDYRKNNGQGPGADRPFDLALHDDYENDKEHDIGGRKKHGHPISQVDLIKSDKEVRYKIVKEKKDDDDAHQDKPGGGDIFE